VLSGVLRILTHPRVFTPATPMEAALAYVAALREQPNVVLLAPGDRHWQIFTRLCETLGVRGNLVPDAYHAALAIEHGCEFVSSDGDYARFRELRWQHPLSNAG
jgi:toxin-antitoxin system PIN domain toxin